MVLFLIVGLGVLVSDLLVSGRLGKLGSFLPEKKWSRFLEPTSRVCAPAWLSWISPKRGPRQRKGYYYVNVR